MRRGDEWEHQESYSCRGWCGRGTSEPDEDQQRAFRCALPGFDEATWGEGDRSPRLYLGRLPIHGPSDEPDPRHPVDDHADGCPGAWYRSAFVDSLARYERILTDHGFTSNVFLDRCDDRLVLEAIQYLEVERVRARAHWQDVRRKAAERS